MKADIFDGGHRVPFVARWPGRIKPGSATGEIGCLTDLMATAAALTSQRLPSGAGEDSFNLLPVMTGKADRSPRQAVVHHSALGMFSIRDRQWKLVLGRGSGGFTEPKKIEPKPGEPVGELYDMAADPGETKNLYAGRPEVVKRLAGLLRKYQQEGRSRNA
jgi:arylsulfatase A-like enzyme